MPLSARIIPVIDLKDGVVVRGVAGRRSEYRPLESRLCDSPAPAIVARALINRFGFTELYVADLDAIAGSEPAWAIYSELVRCGARLMVDAGIRDVARATTLTKFHIDLADKRVASLDVIAGLESVASPQLLSALVEAVGPERLLFSLDLKGGEPLTDSPAWRGMTPADIAAVAISAGIRRMIILDLADVGINRGASTLALCRMLHAAHPTCELIAGGGVRGRDDLTQLSAAGCSAALVASALHDGGLV